ncbi:MAG: hypothetical protein DRJ44_01940 [Thermoprotei archaeon]|nr:MAG: hypothetical protein DRJ44_01940 [Thermoprotei archaeon]
MVISWKVLIHEDALKQARKLGIYNRFIKFARELQKALQETSDSKIKALMREPIVLRIMGLLVRRIRMGKYRIFYYLDFERRVVVISGIEHRKKAYRRG